MSDSVKCDCCGSKGRRRRGCFAPEGWSYAELQEVNEDGSEGTFIVYACSKSCRRLDWQEGPGRLEPLGIEERFLDLIMERGNSKIERTIVVRQGDRLTLGTLQLEVGEGDVFLPLLKG